MPRRSFENVEEFESHMGKETEILLDGTENPVERPKGYDNQKVKYSGKKHAHMDIAMVLSDKMRYIYYLSRLYPGKNVDMGILKKEFPPEDGWFKNFRAIVDLGFVGIGEIYEIKELVIGHKKNRKSRENPRPELTEEQKEWNKKVSRERIYVEHAIGGMKKFRILKNKCRLKSHNLKEKIIGICAGLWNYQLTINV